MHVFRVKLHVDNRSSELEEPTFLLTTAPKLDFKSDSRFFLNGCQDW